MCLSAKLSASRKIKLLVFFDFGSRGSDALSACSSGESLLLRCASAPLWFSPDKALVLVFELGTAAQTPRFRLHGSSSLFT